MALKRLLAAALLIGVLSASADDWADWRGPSRDGVWRETGLLDRFPPTGLEVSWRAPVAGGYSGPTVARGKVYVSDHIVEPSEQERIHCFDASKGRKLWTHSYEAPYRGLSYGVGPRASVIVDGDRAFTLGAVGKLTALHAETGEMAWSVDLTERFGIQKLLEWGFAAAPLVRGRAIYLVLGGYDGAAMTALDRESGKELWRGPTEPGSYAAPMMIRQAGKDVLVCWLGDRVVGVNPATGAEYWSVPFKRKQWVIGIATPAIQGQNLFLSSAIDGSMLVKLSADTLTAEKVWQRVGQNERTTDALHCLISTPVLDGKHIYGVDINGELRCLDAASGDRLWENTTVTPRARWSAAHLVRNGDRYWILNERGELIIARLSPAGYEEISRAPLLKPTMGQLPQRGGVVWSHPAYAGRKVFARNDTELVCADLSARR